MTMLLNSDSCKRRGSKLRYSLKFQVSLASSEHGINAQKASYRGLAYAVMLVLSAYILQHYDMTWE